MLLFLSNIFTFNHIFGITKYNYELTYSLKINNTCIGTITENLFNNDKIYFNDENVEKELYSIKVYNLEKNKKISSFIVKTNNKISVNIIKEFEIPKYNSKYDIKMIEI